MRNKLRRSYRPKRRRRSLKASNAGPFLALIGTVIGILGVIALIVFLGLPWLLPKLGVEYTMPWQSTPTPAPTPRPTPTPHPVSTADTAQLQREIVLTGGNGDYVWFAEPSAYGNSMVFAAGRTVDGDALMDAVFEIDLGAGEITRLDLPLKNHHFVYPTLNRDWLVYLDANEGNGGTLCVLERETAKVREIKTVYSGQPMLRLSGDLLVWTERTGSTVDKLFACDLRTLESVTVQTFSNSEYGLSAPAIAGNQIIYADEDPNETDQNARTSAIYSMDVAQGNSTIYTPGVYVHDPLTNGKQWVWRDGLHSPEDDLYLSNVGGPAKRVAEDIMDYGLSDTFVAYSKDQAIYVYFFDDGTTYQITPDVTREQTQLMGTGDGTVIWMDVTSRERDIMKYARVR